MRIAIALEFDRRGYIANPYWLETSKLIEIQKKSGFNRAKTEQKRRQQLLAYLEKEGITEQQYGDLQALAARRFYTNADGEIVIPEQVFLAFLRSVAWEAPTAYRALPASLVNTTISLAPLRTGKQKEDGIFSRFVKNQETNERRRQEDPYIVGFTARGVLEVDDSLVQPDSLRSMLEWGGRSKGIGAARPMGYGRFQVVGFEVLSE